MKKLYKEYGGRLMESSAYETEEFKSFARKAKNRLKKDLHDYIFTVVPLHVPVVYPLGNPVSEKYKECEINCHYEGDPCRYGPS